MATPTIAFAADSPAISAYGDPNCLRSSSAYNPFDTTKSSTLEPKNTTNRGTGCDTMNCVPMTPAKNPTIVLANPPMPSTRLESASCTSPANVPERRPDPGPDVSATYTTATRTRSTATAPLMKN